MGKRPLWRSPHGRVSQERVVHHHTPMQVSSRQDNTSHAITMNKLFAVTCLAAVGLCVGVSPPEDPCASVQCGSGELCVRNGVCIPTGVATSCANVDCDVRKSKSCVEIQGKPYCLPPASVCGVNDDGNCPFLSSCKSFFGRRQCKYFWASKGCAKLDCSHWQNCVEDPDTQEAKCLDNLGCAEVTCGDAGRCVEDDKFEASCLVA
eukprot:TRINITY_DN4427_c0_g1_i4.p1 TRINITY_DN4427_c0_g1~~TRINITY_DN4427_c0_g1_i4.p1  ORF type:complete len:206 (+),score=49.96 TRINITY_DN4427_c0_g1_i4:271-888(+)